MKSPDTACGRTGAFYCEFFLLHNITCIHSLSFSFHILAFEKIRIELTKSPAKVQTQYLRITTAEYILDKVRRF